ncbi:zinc finger protein 682-like [Thrips palmi]|uniref:Zinc finger protein 682-like n=1 Tax=Thrips palmi TaxID=161013 RepID=A0A6P8YG08_THRPL|nr:zinc finger protein 682-like [Thrips palmi]
MAHCSSSSLNVPNKLISSLFAQKKTNSYCDITLIFGEVELRAHSCVVAAFSPFVDNFLSSGEVMPLSSCATRTSAGTISCLMPCNAKFKCLDCATKVIDFMYLGKIQIDDLHLEHIKAVSESLQVSELLKICRKHSDRIKSLDDCLGTLTSSEPTTVDPVEEEPKVLSKSINPEKQFPSTTVQTSTDGTTLSKDVTALSVNSVSVSDDMDESEWSGMKCPKCELILMSLALYQQHCGTHLGKTYTSCYVCNYTSIRVPDVIKHLQEMDHGEKVCSICLLEVSCSQSLKEHLQIHEQAQPFFCLTCSTRFQTRTALNSHIVRHTNETPFICKECGRGFKWKHGLRSHMVTHSKLKSFLCDQCGFSTAHLRSFIDHKAAHSGEKFKCPKPDCQFSSVRRASVKHHLMTHSKQKPYQCEVCGQAFSQNKNLRRHAASHNPSADPEKCPLCSYQTNRSDKFKAHFKRYHKDGETLQDQLGTKKKSSSTASAVDNSNVSSPENNLPIKKQSTCQRSVIRYGRSNGTLPKIPAVNHCEESPTPNQTQKQTCKTPLVVEEICELSPLNTELKSGATETPLLKLTPKKKKSQHDPSTNTHHGKNSENILLQVSDSITEQFVVFNTNEALSSSDALYTLSNGTYVIMDVENVDDKTVEHNIS